MGAGFPPPSAALLRPFPLPPRVLSSGVVPRRHLRGFQFACRSGAATWLTSGCSLATSNANNAVADSENFFGAVARKLARSYPNVTLTRVDRSIGGTTYNDLSNIPNFAGGITAPSWYTAQGQPWRTYVNNAAPDLSFILMDTNDANGVGGDKIKTVLNNYASLANLPKPPSIVLVTGTGHTQNGTAQSFIDGILQSASLTRSIAACGTNINTFYGLSGATLDCGLIDLNRYDAMARLGIDPCSQYLTVQTSLNSSTQTLPYTLPKCDGDFDLQFTLTGTMNAGTAIKVYCGSTVASGSQTPFVTITNTGNAVTSYSGPGTGTKAGTNISWPGSTVSVQVNCKQEWLRVIIGTTTVLDAPVPRSSYQFTPQITVTGATPTLTINQYASGTCVGHQQFATDTQVYSDASYIHDGNGINHHSNRGVASVILPALEATDFGSIGQLPATNLTAAGSTQAGATLVWSPINNFTTVAASTGALLNSAAVDEEGKILIWNNGANTLAIYPPVGAAIGTSSGTLATNAADTIAVNAFARYYIVANNLWLRA